LIHASSHFTGAATDDSASDDGYDRVSGAPTWVATATVVDEEQMVVEDGSNASENAGGNQEMPMILAYDKDGSRLMKRPVTLPELVHENRRQFPDWMRTARPATLLVENATFSVKLGPNRYRTLLEDISFSVKPRQMVLLLGTPGAGKTTLFRLLSNQLPSGHLEGSYLYSDMQVRVRCVRMYVHVCFSEFGFLVALSVRGSVPIFCSCAHS
jgi:ABC-type multidrug transport system fused ATPase/permease subunit